MDTAVKITAENIEARRTIQRILENNDVDPASFIFGINEIKIPSDKTEAVLIELRLFGGKIVKDISAIEAEVGAGRQVHITF